MLPSPLEGQLIILRLTHHTLNQYTKLSYLALAVSKILHAELKI